MSTEAAFIQWMLAGGRPPPEIDLHKHQCGLWEPGDPVDVAAFEKAGPGCGHVWEHSRKELEAVPDDQFKQASLKAHTCPSCGKGPWLVIKRPGPIDRKFRLSTIGDTK